MAKNIICMKWGDKFGADYVNRLYSMVSRNITGDFRFVCLTDKSDGLRPEVETRPLPEMDLPAGAERGWRKLSTFKPDFCDIDGKVLFLDLDVVIVGSLDCFFEPEGEFFVIREWKKSRAHGLGNSSVYRFEAGTLSFVYEHFMSHIDEVKRDYRHEQSYLCDTLRKRGMLKFWPEGWCVSFKRCCMRPFPLNFFQAPRIPDGARVVVFHGRPNPDEALEGKMRGIKKILRYARPARWIGKYWK